MGVVQNAGTLARIVGPVIATSLYHWRLTAPFIFCAIMAAVAGGAAMIRLKRPAVAPLPT